MVTCRPLPSFAEHGNICQARSLIACRFKPYLRELKINFYKHVFIYIYKIKFILPCSIYIYICMLVCSYVVCIYVVCMHTFVISTAVKALRRSYDK